ncbi:MAG: 2,3-diphosphoglycerate synthetase [Actinobacteria bacterium]|nr:2,3-diphosphoglycerate synthetase [Actinomycetota bacterium]
MKNLLQRRNNRNKKLVALIDGEHYPQVNRDAINLLKECFSGVFCGIIFLGGTEKISGMDLKEYYGEKIFIIRELDTDFIEALRYFKPDIAYDLSDEPVVDYQARMKIASFCLVEDCDYMGPDFLFSHQPEKIKVSKPGISIIGTGKRIGKTAISSHIARIFKGENIEVCIVAMGRGGPGEPRVMKGSEVEITPRYLLDLSRSGIHASSDYIEDALLGGITTVGCRRCGGGFGGGIFMTNVDRGIEIAETLNPGVMIVEGSGASVPPVSVDCTICVVGAHQGWESIVGYLGIYRIMMADLVILTMCEEPMASEEEILLLENEIRKFNPAVKIIRTVFRPRPLSNIKNRKIFVALTAQEAIRNKIESYLEMEYGAEVASISFALADRTRLKKDLMDSPPFDMILTELKAAAVDFITEYALKNMIGISYIDNIPLILNKNVILREELFELLKMEKIKYAG